MGAGDAWYGMDGGDDSEDELEAVDSGTEVDEELVVNDDGSEVGDDVEQGGLATPRGPENTQQLTRFEGQRYVFKRLNRVAIGQLKAHREIFK